jgi:predicted  nucleic acid-binding Zn-ribbon protein
MAENVLKLKVQSEEYDAKIKRAAEGIQHFVKDVRESGSTLKESGILARAFLQELGNMETVAKGGKQQLREMSNALVTLTDTYRGLSDAEKSSGFGQELNKQIQILTERAGTMQDAMADVQASIQNAASDTRMFDQLAGGAQLLTASFQTATGAAEMLGYQFRLTVNGGKVL